MDCYRTKTFERILHECISDSYLPTDITLFSVIRGTSILPLSSFLHHSKFLRYEPTIEELISSCEYSNTLKNRIVFCPDPCIVLPFFVDATTLIVEKVINTKLNDFRKIVSSVLGHRFFEVHPYSSGSFKTRFADISTAVSFIRALKYIPINNGYVVCHPVYSPSPFPEKGKLVPIPQRKKKVVRNEKVRKAKANKTKNLKKTPEQSLPAAIPMAILLSSLNQVPQAVLIESQKASSIP